MPHYTYLATDMPFSSSYQPKADARMLHIHQHIILEGPIAASCCMLFFGLTTTSTYHNYQRNNQLTQTSRVSYDASHTSIFKVFLHRALLFMFLIYIYHYYIYILLIYIHKRYVHI